MDTQIKYANIEVPYIGSISAKNTSVRDIKLKALVKLREILTNLVVNNCYF